MSPVSKLYLPGCMPCLWPYRNVSKCNNGNENRNWNENWMQIENQSWMWINTTNNNTNKTMGFVIKRSRVRVGVTFVMMLIIWCTSLYTMEIPNNSGQVSINLKKGFKY